MARIGEKSKYTIWGAAIGGAVLFCIYFFSMYPVLTMATVTQTLIIPTVFGVAAGIMAGRELYAKKQGRQREEGLPKKKECCTAAQEEGEIEQKGATNVKGMG